MKYLGVSYYIIYLDGLPFSGDNIFFYEISFVSFGTNSYWEFILFLIIIGFFEVCSTTLACLSEFYLLFAIETLNT